MSDNRRKKPMISVLMSTYNTPAQWLLEAIESILNQTYGDFEFLIADDCSTEDLTPVKEQVADSRVVWVRNETNLGLTKTLNKLLAMAGGRYIARMDADDISLPQRFADQITYMESHPEVIVCGSYRRAFGDENKDEKWDLPATREEQQIQLFFFNCGLTHPTAMFRKSMMDAHGIAYNESYHKAQDYGIWVQCTRYAPMSMLPKVLLQYRKSERQISSAGHSSQQENADRVRIDQLAALGIAPTQKEKALHLQFCLGVAEAEAPQVEAWVNRLLKANDDTGYFDKRLFWRILCQRWYDLCKKKYKTERNGAYKDAYQRIRRPVYVWNDTLNHVKRQVVKMTSGR